MNQLKYLGKPAPEYIGCCGNGEYCNERAGDKDCPCEAKIESLEGAIKEANFMLVTFRKKWPKEIWKEWDAWLDTQPTILTDKYGSYEKHFVAFLLRKTIGDKE